MKNSISHLAGHMEQSSKKRLKIAICMRQVPDTATRVKISSTGKSLDTSNIQYVINPYEEYALEEAIRIKEKTENEKKN